MENQHRKITGYRELSQSEIDLMNEVKEQGKVLDALITQMTHNHEVDRRWLEIGTTNLQLGLMALTRAIAKPSSF